MPKKLIENIKSEKWFRGVRAVHNELLIYSLKCEGENQFIKKIYGKEFTQSRMLLPEGKGNVRMIGIGQAKKFHEISKKQVVKSPEILVKTIKEDEIILKEILNQAKKGDNLEKIIKNFKEHAFLFFKGFSLGLMLFENKNSIGNKKRVAEILKIHDDWRNSVADEEKNIIKNIKPQISSVAKKAGLENINDIFYLEISELEKGLKNGFEQNLKPKIKERKGLFCYVQLMGNSWIISNKKEVKEIKDIFNEDQKLTNILKGMVAYKSKNKVKGKVIILNNPRSAKDKKGDILVALQTTPNFIPIIKRFSAIITDEGGITSHAAIISREFKIPCIVGTRNATKILKNGNLVEVDTQKGIINILK